jgi:hypothetical protein
MSPPLPTQYFLLVENLLFKYTFCVKSAGNNLTLTIFAVTDVHIICLYRKFQMSNSYGSSVTFIKPKAKKLFFHNGHVIFNSVQGGGGTLKKSFIFHIISEY